MVDNFIQQEEVPLNGSSRIGLQRFPDRASIDINGAVSSSTSGVVYNRSRGEKLFEFSNHLGNVLTTVSDQKIGIADVSNVDALAFYEANIVSANDYYPFGLQMPLRNYNSPKYRYGFNDD